MAKQSTPVSAKKQRIEMQESIPETVVFRLASDRPVAFNNEMKRKQEFYLKEFYKINVSGEIGSKSTPKAVRAKRAPNGDSASFVPEKHKVNNEEKEKPNQVDDEQSLLLSDDDDVIAGIDISVCETNTTCDTSLKLPETPISDDSQIKRKSNDISNIEEDDLLDSDDDHVVSMINVSDLGLSFSQ